MTILLVDDNDLILRALSRQLRANGCMVTTAAGVGEATMSAAKLGAQGEYFDTVVTDIDMDDGTGFDLAKNLLVMRAPQRIIFMSGYVDGARQAEAKRLGGVLLDKMDLAAILDEVQR